ncbi:MAG: FAD-dependent oxidoreductase [Chitinophagaceae bacterium]
MAIDTKVTSFLNRDKMLKQARNADSYDVLVIGGGATGLGIALDACTRGYRTLLLEQSDFAKGTSSRSTKLVHGGVRYLAQGDVRLVREASIERGLLVRNAPHLVRDQTFIVPVYSLFDRLKYNVGLKLYDWIAGRLRLGPSRFISKAETVRKLPGISSRGLRGGIQYHDGQFDDSRLAINIAQSIAAQGGHLLNYTKVTGLLKNEQGHVVGVQAIDLESQEVFQFAAGAVINATGVFVDDILQMDKPGSKPSITVSQGIHLVLDRSFYPGDDALMIPKTSDGRVLFAVPWHQKVVIGTTDTPVQTASLEPVALEKEIQFILDTAAHYFTRPPRRADVLSVFAGLRPLAAPKDGEQKTKEISRSHKIVVTPSRLFTILGGKWTTFRKMGEDMMNRVENELSWPQRQPQTEHLAIHGAMLTENWNDPLYFYGTDAITIRENIASNNEPWLSEELKIHSAQVRWAVEHEMARTVEDVLARRTRALLLDAKETRRIAPAVASIMASSLGKNEQWIEAQLTSFNALTKKYILQ